MEVLSKPYWTSLYPRTRKPDFYNSESGLLLNLEAAYIKQDRITFLKKKSYICIAKTFAKSQLLTTIHYKFYRCLLKINAERQICFTSNDLLEYMITSKKMAAFIVGHPINHFINELLKLRQRWNKFLLKTKSLPSVKVGETLSYQRQWTWDVEK